MGLARQHTAVILSDIFVRNQETDSNYRKNKELAEQEQENSPSV